MEQVKRRIVELKFKERDAKDRYVLAWKNGVALSSFRNGKAKTSKDEYALLTERYARSLQLNLVNGFGDIPLMMRESEYIPFAISLARKEIGL